MVSPEPTLLADKWQLEAAAQEVTFTEGQKKPKQMFTNPRQTKVNKFSLRLLPPLQLFCCPLRGRAGPGRLSQRDALFRPK